MSIPTDRTWERLVDCGPFTDHCGPMYQTEDGLDPGECARLAFRVAPNHCNPRPICHGGMLATFADIAMARGLRAISGVKPPVPTISMSIDYLDAVPLDAWVEARISVPRVGKSTAFVQAMFYVEEMPVLRASGVFRHFGNR